MTSTGAAAAAGAVREESRRRLVGLSGAFRGQRCFVMGNGPSLNHVDLDAFAGESVWAANRAYLLFDRISWRPRFFVVKDPVVLRNSGEEISRLVAELPATTFFFPSHFLDEALVPAGENVVCYEESPEAGGFSTSVADRVARSRTVTVIALQLAVHLGFDPIHLVGCDNNYARDGQDPTLGADPDHFDPRYLDDGRGWDKPDVAGMTEDYRAARRAADALGARILNATRGGHLEEFPRVALESLFPGRAT